MAGTKSRSFAVVCTVIMVVLAIFIGGMRSLVSLRSEAEEVFYEETTSIQSDLDRRVDQAANLTTLSSNSVEDTAGYIKALEVAKEDLKYAVTISEKKAANNRLTAAVDQLMIWLSTSDMSDDAYRRCENLETELIALNRTIELNEYNTEAAKFNRTISQIPTRFLARAINVRPLDTFGS